MIILEISSRGESIGIEWNIGIHAKNKLSVCEPRLACHRANQNVQIE